MPTNTNTNDLPQNPCSARDSEPTCANKKCATLNKNPGDNWIADGDGCLNTTTGDKADMPKFKQADPRLSDVQA